MARVGMARVGMTLVLMAAALVGQIGPAGAAVHRAGSRVVRPSIAAGGGHSCSLLANGTVKCWGDNSSGELGNGTTTRSSPPVLVSGLTTAVAMSAAFGHSCAVLPNGTAKCWGDNSYGELGNGTTINSSTPVVVSGI